MGYLVHVDGTPATKESIVALLTSEKISCNHVRDKAGDRGLAVHDAFELWATEGVVPNPELFAETERGYVEGLVKFITESKVVPLHAEVMVGSFLHKYAGRFDLLCAYGGEEVCTHTTPTGRNSKTEALEPGVFLLDLKTSGNVWPNHHLQLAAYKQAAMECGYATPDQEAIIRVTNDGRYEMVPNKATFNDFQQVYGTWKSLQRIK